MRVLRLYCMLALVVMTFTALSSTAAGAATKSYPVDLFAQADDGAIDTEGFTQITPSGSAITDFTLPSKKALVIGSIWVTFIPQGTPGGPYHFVIDNGGDPATLFWRWGFSEVGSGGTFVELQQFLPGLAIGIKPVMKVENDNGDVVAGTLKVRVLGSIE